MLGQPSAARESQHWSHKSFLNSCSAPPTPPPPRPVICHFSSRFTRLDRKESLSSPPSFLSLSGSGKAPSLSVPGHPAPSHFPSWFRPSEKQNFLSPAVWEPRGEARACGRAGRRARGRGWRGSGGPGKEEGASPRLCPLPVSHRLPRPPSPQARAQQAARCRAGVPGALRSTTGAMAQVGPGSQEEGERGLRKSGRGSGYNSGPTRPGAGEGNRGRERGVQGEGGRVSSCHCSSCPSTSQPGDHGRSWSAVRGGRARSLLPSACRGGPAGVECVRVWVGPGAPCSQPRVAGADPAGTQGEVGRDVENCSPHLPGAARRPLPIVDCDAPGSAGRTDRPTPFPLSAWATYQTPVMTSS